MDGRKFVPPLWKLYGRVRQILKAQNRKKVSEGPSSPFSFRSRNYCERKDDWDINNAFEQATLHSQGYAESVGFGHYALCVSILWRMFDFNMR